MFNNVGGFIKMLSKIFSILGLIAFFGGLLVLLIFLVDGEEAGILISAIVSGSGLILYIGSIFTYSWGITVENIERIKNFCYKSNSGEITAEEKEEMPEL